jgi:hypothetical protein
LRKGLQANLILFCSLQEFDPNNSEFHTALMIKNRERIQRFELPPNRPQSHAIRCEVECMGEFLKRHPGSVFSSHPNGQHRLYAILPPPLGLDTDFLHRTAHSVRQIQKNRNGPDEGGTKVTNSVALILSEKSHRKRSLTAILSIPQREYNSQKIRNSIITGCRSPYFR